MKQSDVYRKLV